MTPQQRWRVAIGLIVILGIALRIDTLAIGPVMDDIAQRAMLDGSYAVARAPWDLFSFVDGDPAEVQRLTAAGSLPWWSDPQLRLSTLRPLSSLLVAFDGAVFGDAYVLHHVHSLLWWTAMLLAGARLLRRLLPTPWALLAFALWVLDESHVQPLAWLANRNAIVATCCGLVGFEAHLRWREAGGARTRAWSLVMLALSFAAGEYALCIVALLLAHELTMPAGADRRRALAGVFAVVLAWALLHRGLGYGGQRSAIYVDPLGEPGAWLAAAQVRLPVLLADLGLALPTGTLAFSASALRWQALVGLFAVVLLYGRARMLVGTRPQLRWAAWAAVLAVIPVVSAFPSARLLLVASLPAHVLIAGLVLDGAQAWRDDGGRVVRGARMALAAVLVVAHVGLATLWGRRELGDIATFAAAGERAALAMPVDDDALPQQHVVVFAAADPMTLLYPPLLRHLHGHPLPRAWTVLSLAPGPHRLHRTSSVGFDLTVVQGAMLRGPVEQLFRRADALPPVGTEVALDRAWVTVREVDDAGFVRRISVRFDRPLEDSSLVFLIATPRGFLRYPLARVGTEIELPPAMAPLVGGG